MSIDDINPFSGTARLIVDLGTARIKPLASGGPSCQRGPASNGAAARAAAPRPCPRPPPTSAKRNFRRRARMAAEGEQPVKHPEQSKKRSRYEPQRGALLGTKRDE